MEIAGGRRRRLGFIVALVAVVAVAVVVLVVQLHRSAPAGVLQPGDELKTAEVKPYGWSGSMAVGARFTNGLNFIPVSDHAKGPLRLISVTPVLDQGPVLRVVGVLARITPDMLPKDADTGWFESANGFPPKDHDAAGGVDPAGLTVRVPASGEVLNVELQIGYQVAAVGKSNQLGVRVRYDYQGAIHEILIPSHITICAPAKAACSADHS